MKMTLLKSLEKFAKILFKNNAKNKQVVNFEFEASSAFDITDEIQQYIINRNLRHIDYIYQLEEQINTNKIEGFSQDFYDELKSSKLICKINTIKTTSYIAVNSHAA